MEWDAVIFGPEDTIWEGGVFNLTMKFSEEYPNKAPNVRFTTSMFHPNIYADGSICIDMLQGQWSPIYDVSSILTSLQSLLCDPNPNSPANQEAAKLFLENIKEYNRRVKECVEATWEGEGEEEDSDDDYEDVEDEDEKLDETKAKVSGQSGDIRFYGELKLVSNYFKVPESWKRILACSQF